jgi:hypothetical protein
MIAAHLKSKTKTALRIFATQGPVAVLKVAANQIGLHTPPSPNHEEKMRRRLMAPKLEIAKRIFKYQGLSAAVQILIREIWPQPPVFILNMAYRIVGAYPPTYEGTFNGFRDKRLFEYFRIGPIADELLLSTNIRKYIISDRDVPISTQRKFGPLIRSLDEIPTSDIKNALFYIYFTCDSDALSVLKKITRCGGRYIPHTAFTKTHYRFVNRQAYESMRKTWEKSKRISHLSPIVHENLCEALELTNEIEGDYVEIGVYLGGSALTALNYLTEKKKTNAKHPRKAWLLDTFRGFSYEEANKSADIIWAGTCHLFGIEETKAYLKETLKDTGIPFELVENNICINNLPLEITKIAVANIDVDLYEPTRAALDKVAGLMSVGGIIIAEDAASTPALYGAFLALSEFLETPLGQKFLPIFKEGVYFLLRTKE